jgi:hypothetical protein
MKVAVRAPAPARRQRARPPVQRKCGCGGACCAGGPAPVQRASTGAPLPAATRASMESSFGHDFGGVRVHTDSGAASQAASLGARAFTTGSDIYFAPGEYAPASPGGTGLLAHELTHVVQQRAGRAPAGGLDTPGDPFEREAEAAAATILAGQQPRIALAGPVAGVQRATVDSKPKPIPAAKRLEIPGDKVAGGSDRTDVLNRYKARATAGALTTKLHAGRGNTDTLWNVWESSRPYKVTASTIKAKRKVCQPDHVIELQLGGSDSGDNLRMLEATRNERIGSQLSQNITKFLAENTLSADAVVRLGPDDFDIGTGSADKDCLSWELDMLAGKEAQTEAGVGQFPAVVGGLEVDIGYNPAADKVHAHSRYIVPLLRLETLHDTEPFPVTAAISDRAKIPAAWDKDRGKAFNLQIAGGPGGKLEFANKSDKLRLNFPFLSDAELDLRMEKGQAVAEGSFKPTVPLLKTLDVHLKVAGDTLTGGVAVPKEKLKEALPVPGLEITETSVAITAANGQFSATGAFAIKYSTIADARAEVSLGNTKPFEAVGTLNLHVPGIDEAKGQIWYRAGKLGGSVHIGAEKLKIPGVKSASLDVLVQDGALTGEGVVDLAVPGVKQARLGFGVDKNGNYSISGTAVLAIPGTKEATLGLTYRNGELEGAAHVGLNVPGLESATVDVLWRKGALTGAAALAYKKGKLSGTVNVALSERHKLSGSGELAYEIAPGLVAFAGVKIAEDASMKVSGGLRVPETLEIFARRQVEKPLFKLPTIEIPILAVPLGTRSVGIVATIDARLVARAGVGPGQLRKVKLAAEFDPARIEETFSFHAAAELYVPADAELALQIAGGIGVSLAIARAVGGIEAEGAAGLRGEFIAGADIAYEKGQLAIAGKAELSAQPRLVFRLKAFVRVEADIFITTIELYKKEWQLAQFEAGSALKVGVRIPFKYVFGQPFQLSLDQVEFIVPEISPKDLIKQVLPA